MQIGELAERVGINASAVRYYESIGLLPRVARKSGWRQYGDEDFKRLKVIHTARRIGFTLEEIKQLLDEFPESADPTERWRRIASKKLPELEKIIQQTTALKYLIEAGLDCACNEIELCISSKGLACRPKLHSEVLARRKAVTA